MKGILNQIAIPAAVATDAPIAQRFELLFVQPAHALVQLFGKQMPVKTHL